MKFRIVQGVWLAPHWFENLTTTEHGQGSHMSTEPEKIPKHCQVYPSTKTEHTKHLNKNKIEESINERAVSHTQKQEWSAPGE